MIPFYAKTVKYNIIFLSKMRSNFFKIIFSKGKYVKPNPDTWYFKISDPRIRIWIRSKSSRSVHSALIACSIWIFQCSEKNIINFAFANVAAPWRDSITIPISMKNRLWKAGIPGISSNLFPPTQLWGPGHWTAPLCLTSTAYWYINRLEVLAILPSPIRWPNVELPVRWVSEF